ncbi:MAG: SlyX family protein [Alphaproteobacteria bacterium]|nr:SlyX family protein [Alphaproteobacteria bacterium]
MKDIEERLNELECFLANQDKMLEELNAEVLRQSKIINALVDQNKQLMNAMKDGLVKPLSEETKPPHY